MTTRVNAKFYQSARGAPLQCSAVATIEGADDWSNENAMGWGVKATSAAPTATSDFAATLSDSFGSRMDREVITWYMLQVPAGTPKFNVHTLDGQTKITLNSDWVAGHYAFAYVEGVAGALLAASRPFLIR